MIPFIAPDSSALTSEFLWLWVWVRVTCSNITDTWCKGGRKRPQVKEEKIFINIIGCVWLNCTKSTDFICSDQVWSQSNEELLHYGKVLLKLNSWTGFYTHKCVCICMSYLCANMNSQCLHIVNVLFSFPHILSSQEASRSNSQQQVSKPEVPLYTGTGAEQRALKSYWETWVERWQSDLESHQLTVEELVSRTQKYNLLFSHYLNIKNLKLCFDCYNNSVSK